MTFNPMHSERLLLNPIALGGLLTVLFASLDMKGTIHHRFPYLLYFLSLSARPRMVYTVDEDLEPVRIPPLSTSLITTLSRMTTTTKNFVPSLVPPFPPEIPSVACCEPKSRPSGGYSRSSWASKDDHGLSNAYCSGTACFRRESRVGHGRISSSFRRT